MPPPFRHAFVAATHCYFFGLFTTEYGGRRWKGNDGWQVASAANSAQHFYHQQSFRQHTGCIWNGALYGVVFPSDKVK
jgi:hypothetical protein